jgi:uncharacterized protein DUF6627
MSSSLMKFISKILVVSMLWLPMYQASATMVGTEQVVTQAQSQYNRDQLLNTISRADVSQHMQSLGLSPENAKARVNAMTDAEVQQLSAKLDSMPAGAASGWAWAAAVVIVAALIWFVFYDKK